MSIRTTIAGLAAAVVLGAGALIGGSVATSTSAEAAPGWHGKGGHGHHGHFGGGHFGGGHRFGHRGWGGPRFAYSRGYYGGCRTFLATRFVPGYGLVERPVTRCR